MNDQEMFNEHHARAVRNEAILREIAQHRVAIQQLMEEKSLLWGIKKEDFDLIVSETRELKKQERHAAVRHYRARTNCGLKEAMCFVDILD